MITVIDTQSCDMQSASKYAYRSGKTNRNNNDDNTSNMITSLAAH